MTQYGIRMSFCDIELEVLQKAIAHYLNLCKRELKNGKRAPFIAHSEILKWIRADLEKATKGRLEVSLRELERPTLQLALKSYVDALEQEIAAHANKSFRPDIELAKTLCEAISVELWRAVFVGELEDERRERRSARRD
jgi:LPS O-antigen subunit length determinant protein (WzzB/FepE family)